LPSPELHNADQRAYFESVEKRTMVPHSTRYLQRQTDELVKAAGLKTEDDILEVGAGMGRYTLLLAERGFRVTAIDLSAVLLERLQAYDGGRHQIATSAIDILDAPEDWRGRFDAVVGFFALHHMHDLDACVRSMALLTRPGGTLCFLEPNAFSPLYPIQVTITPGMSFRGESGLFQMHPGRLGRCFEAAGLVGFESRTFGFFPPVLANLRGAAGVERALESLPGVGGIRPFRLFLGRRPG
jgi:SAM-dependent methyltransferase